MKTSLIVISYNQERFIKEALLGILSQTILPDEVIISDDGSSDCTQTIIQEFVRENNLSHWKLLLNSKNEGITRNLRKAIDNSTGDILILNAGDDISYPQRIEIAIKAFEENPKVNIVTGNLDVVNSTGEIVGEIINDPQKSNDIGETIIKGVPSIHPVGQSFRRNLFNIFGELPVDVPNEDDQLSFWGIISGGIYCVNEKVMKYRVHDKSASSWLRKNKNLQEYYTRLIEDMPVRQRHMELWRDAIKKQPLQNQAKYIEMLNHKINIYSFFSRLDGYSLFPRINCILKNYNYLSFREKYYLLGGRWGIKSWRLFRNLIRG